MCNNPNQTQEGGWPQRKLTVVQHYAYGGQANVVALSIAVIVAKMLQKVQSLVLIFVMKIRKK